LISDRPPPLVAVAGPVFKASVTGVIAKASAAIPFRRALVSHNFFVLFTPREEQN